MPAKKPSATSRPDTPEFWSAALHRTDRGEVRDVLHNAAIILRRDGRFAGRLRWNEMTEAVEASDLPWSEGSPWHAWTDADDLQFANWCQERQSYLKPRTCAAAVQVVARDQAVHPVRERLSSLTWDKTPRLSRWLFDCLGATVERDENENEEQKKAAQARELYLEEVGRRWMISAVARVFKPGCKVDTALILQGDQGKKKSSAAELMALEPEWFADEVADLGTKDAAQDLRGKWIIELGELSAMKRGEVERVKAFMSRRRDHYRPSYGIRSQDFERQCVFIGSTNEAQYLKDHTGNRRFWPVTVGKIDVAKLAREREQLWAEAVVAFQVEKRWWLDEEVEHTARDEQAARRIEDAWEEPIREWLKGRTETTVGQVLTDAIGMDLERQGRQGEEKRAAQGLIAAGWKRVQRRIKGRPTWVYVSPPTPTGDSPGEAKAALPPGDTPFPPGDSDPPTGDSGPEKPSDSAGVTTVTTVTSKFSNAYVRARPEVSGTAGYTGDSGDSPPEWDDDRGWIGRLKSVQSRQDKQSVVFAWGRAAGGTVQDGEHPALTLPRDLPKGMASVELRRVARDAGIEVTS